MIDLAVDRREALVAELDERLETEDLPTNMGEGALRRALLEDPQIRRLWRLRGDLFSLETERAQQKGADGVQQTAFEMGSTVDELFDRRIGEVLEEELGDAEQHQTDFWAEAFDEEQAV